MGTCIFCTNKTKDEPVEHIIPEGLIGHSPYDLNGRQVYLVLDKDEVCKDCNIKRLGPLDENLQKQLGPMKVLWNEMGTKSGKLASAERHGMFVVRGKGGPEFYFNTGTKKLEPKKGITIQPSAGHPDSVRNVQMTRDGSILKVGFDMPVRMGKKFFRGLFKIAFELLCLHKGPEEVLKPTYDGIRDYVRQGRGSRTILMFPGIEEIFNRPQLTITDLTAISSGTVFWHVKMNLGPTFYIDLHSENMHASVIPEKLADIGVLKISDSDFDSKGCFIEKVP